jgi:hypothetical protein
MEPLDKQAGAAVFLENRFRPNPSGGFQTSGFLVETLEDGAMHLFVLVIPLR